MTKRALPLLLLLLATVSIRAQVSFNRILRDDREPQNWLTYWGDYGGTHYSALKQIDTANVAQLAPAFFGGLFWRRATARGAMGGMLVGFAVWIYTLFLPSFLDTSTAGLLLLQHGLFGIEALVNVVPH